MMRLVFGKFAFGKQSKIGLSSPLDVSESDWTEAVRRSECVRGLAVGHRIDDARLDQAWFRRRAAWQAVSDYLMDPYSTPAHAPAAALSLGISAGEGNWALYARYGADLTSTYRQVIPDLWRITDAIERIQKLLPDYPEGAAMSVFTPAVAAEDSNRTLKMRAAAASTFVAGLELAKQEVLGLEQCELFGGVSFYTSFF